MARGGSSYDTDGTCQFAVLCNTIRSESLNCGTLMDAPDDIVDDALVFLGRGDNRVQSLRYCGCCIPGIQPNNANVVEFFVT